MSKNRARDRAAKAEMERTGARRAKAVRKVDTTGQDSPYPVSLVDDNGERWYLQSGQANAYGTRSLDWSESRTYEEITEQAGPVRHIDVPADDDFPRIRQALTDAGPTALSTLIAALHAAATAAEEATGRPEDLVAGRPGSTESVIVLQMTLDVGPRVPATSIDPASLEVIAPILTRWVTGETVVEVAENLAHVLGGLVDGLGWHGITDPWTRRNVAPYASWATSHSSNPVGAHRARAAAELLDEAEETVASTAFLLDASMPSEPDPGLVGDSTMEQLFAALVARALHTLDRDGAEYPARADVFVLPPGITDRPDDAPPGWRRVAALVVVTARRPWELDEDEDQRVITDAFRAVRDALNRYWPGLPEEHEHAALSLDMLAALRGQFTAEAVREVYRDLVGSAVYHTYTLGADPELDPSGQPPA
ncbi:hypothetical protein HUT19_41540 (plasmid) [Streptomyces sp. NA02950]|uniref:hypothetical protein n=1 Tax=Streptomyces sp. NA02950 TaxID=2742137 RepID=UPI001591F580|nr:hypothetical protein [Streptomyces sp. NA02950]QKV98208.1 hypothetical protein HUT19_41540 [Streptomyces sp. NA02950]